jgi:hypothetical protein
VAPAESAIRSVICACTSVDRDVKADVGAPVLLEVLSPGRRNPLTALVERVLEATAKLARTEEHAAAPVEEITAAMRGRAERFA